MRLLLVEDDPEIVTVFETEFSVGFVLVHAASRETALQYLAESTFDLAICDLRIPSESGAMDEDAVHGRAVLTRLLEDHPGTPVVAFSAYGTIELMQELLRRARQEDFLGEGVPRELLIFFSKDQLPDCIALIHDIAAEIEQLDRIEIATGMARLELTWEHERILRVYARRLAASVVRASPLTGGLSGSRVLRLRLEASGAHVASVVAKLDDIKWVEAECHNVETLVAPTLASGSYPSAVTLVRAGAGNSGGLFYRFAGGFERSLRDVVTSHDAPRVVEAVRNRLEPWRDGAPVERTTLEEIREGLVRMEQIPEGHRDAVAADESLEIAIRRATAHRDLHICNVLLSDSQIPMIIDFASVGPAPASVDPVTLELSVIFHPGAHDMTRSWPTLEQADHWDDFDRYVDGCPSPKFIESCRLWAFDVAAGDLEVYAVLYAYALRQLRFDRARRDVALALAGCALRRLGVTRSARL